MNSGGVVEHMRIHEESRLSKSEESSPPERQILSRRFWFIGCIRTSLSVACCFLRHFLRIQQDSYELGDIAAFGSVENISGYSSRMEFDYFGFLKEIFIKKKTNISTEETEQICFDQVYSFIRKTRPFIEREDKINKLSDQLILMILKWLPKECLVSSMLVCKRWCQIARDEALWATLYLGGKVLNEGTLGHILLRGVRDLTLEYVNIVDPVFCEGSEVLSDSYISKLEYLDLRVTVISPVGLAALLSKCKYLKILSLWLCTVNRDCWRAIMQNTELEDLHLTRCRNINIECIMDLTKLKCLTSLRMAESLDNECMTLLCRTLPISITHIFLEDFGEVITDDHIKDLTKSCPDIIKLQLYNCFRLTMRTVHFLLKLSKLRRLSVIDCFNIPPSGQRELARMPGLLRFDTDLLEY